MGAAPWFRIGPELIEKGRRCRASPHSRICQSHGSAMIPRRAPGRPARRRGGTASGPREPTPARPDAIAGAQLKPGDRLPSHRDLATQLVIAPLTVKKAYDELEQGRLIETQRGRGTFVRQRLEQPDPIEKRERLREAGQRLLSQVSWRGLAKLVSQLSFRTRQLPHSPAERNSVAERE